MKKTEQDMAKAILEEGQGLSAKSWLRIPMSAILLGSGGYLLYAGFSNDRLFFLVFGCVFIVLSILICFIVRRAEHQIQELEENIEHIKKLVETQEINLDDLDLD